MNQTNVYLRGFGYKFHIVTIIIIIIILIIIITAWRVLGLRMEETASGYGGKLRVYRESSLLDIPWELGWVIAFPHRKKQLVTKYTRGLEIRALVDTVMNFRVP
jgi:hypothetical protein